MSIQIGFQNGRAIYLPAMAGKYQTRPESVLTGHVKRNMNHIMENKSFAPKVLSEIPDMRNAVEKGYFSHMVLHSIIPGNDLIGERFPDFQCPLAIANGFLTAVCS